MVDEPLVLLASARIIRIPLGDEVRDGGLASIREVAAHLPEASSLTPGTMVAVADRVQGARKPGMLERMTGHGAAPTLHRAARCTALLARGYVRVGGGSDKDKTDWAWGFAP
jgi:hypothetical protein